MDVFFVALLGGGLLLATSCAASQPESGEAPPSTPSTSSATQPGKTVVAPEDAAVTQLLERMDAAGDDMQTFTAGVLLREIDYDVMSEIPRLGRLSLDRTGENVKFRVEFLGIIDESSNPPMLDPDKVDYILIGDELIERTYNSRTQITRKLPPEHANLDLLKLGEGPFPLPIGQSPAEVREQFDVALVDPAALDEDEGDVLIAEGATRLRLVPKPTSDFAGDFKWVDVDVDPSTGLPVKVITLDKPEVNLQITTLRDPQVNAELPGDTFTLPEVNLAEWNVQYEAL
ncbi:MAG: hypothetical protein AAGK78_06710 [Planctomycetota bacterium]